MGKCFQFFSKNKKEEIFAEIQNHKIFFLNTIQLVYGLEDTCHYSYIPSGILAALIKFTPIMLRFLTDFNLTHIYTYCVIEDFLLESDEKIFAELESLSRTYSYKNGGPLLSLTRILFYLFNGYKEFEEEIANLVKFINNLFVEKTKPQSFEKTLNQLNNNPWNEKIRKWIDNIDYFSGKKTPLIEVFSQVNKLLFFLFHN